MPKREQPGSAVPWNIVRLCVGYAALPSAATWAQVFAEPAGLPWMLPAGHRYGESSPRQTPVTVSRFVAAGVKPVVQSRAVCVPPVPAVLPPEKTFLTCHVLSASGPSSCSGNMLGSAAASTPSQM